MNEPNIMKRAALLIVLMGLTVLGMSLTTPLPDDLGASINERLKRYLSTHTQEKAYLHTDKPYYATGDTVWIKAYLVDAIYHEADSLSRVLYVNLTHEAGGLVEHQMIEANYGYAVGHFVLPDTLPEGKYQLTAFTNWMRNSSEEFFFRKSFQVFRPDKQRGHIQVSFDEVADVQFFPEGGNLVEGLRNRVGFKAVNAAGYGTRVEGSVEEVGGTKVLDFAAEHLGMGAFAFTPQAGKSYVARVRANGKVLSLPLPPIQQQGVVLSVGSLMADNVKFTISHNYPSPQLAPVILVAHTRGQVLFSSPLPQSSFSQFYVSRNKLSADGVVVFTVFDGSLRPLAERIIFNDRQQHLRLSIEGLRPSYAPREQVNLTLKATDANGQAVKGNFSVSVTSASQIRDEDLHPNHILSYLLLSSELRGTIEQPARYFDPSNEKAPQHLDLLMLTQGWRRFGWKDVLQDSPKPTYPIERGITLSGRIYVVPARKLDRTAVNLVIEPTVGGPAILSTETDANGDFSIPEVNFNGFAQVSLKGLGRIGTKGAALFMDNTPVPDVSTKMSVLPSSLIMPETLENYLLKLATQRKANRLLKSANSATTDKPVTQPEAPDGRRRIYGSPDYSLKITDQISDGTNDVFQLIRGRISGLTGTGNDLQIRGINSFVGSTEPLYLLDGVPTDKGTILSVPPKDVESIDVLKGASASSFGARGAGGVINVLTKRGSGPSGEGQNNRVRGYALVREFYNPQYLSPKAINTLPDYRSTIYWQPMLQTDETGKASFSFWNSDESNAKFRIVVEGATPNGQLGVSQHWYQLQ